MVIGDQCSVKERMLRTFPRVYKYPPHISGDQMSERFFPDIRNLHIQKSVNDRRVEVGDGDELLGGDWGGKATAIKVQHLGNMDIVEVCFSRTDENCIRCPLDCVFRKA